MSRNERFVLDNFEPTLTQQQFKDECDVNQIVAKYIKSTGVDWLNQYQGCLNPSFIDCTNVVDYQSALSMIEDSRAMFMALPPELRKRFDNDPGKFLDFADDKNNLDEMVKMGLVKPQAAEPVVEPKAESKKPKAEKAVQAD